MVRLTSSQIHTLIDATHKCFGNSANIWLFGSRTDDTKRGGDIDLFIETDLQLGIVNAKLKMREELWLKFGEQKIDLLIRSRHKELSPMHKLAKDSGVELIDYQISEDSV